MVSERVSAAVVGVGIWGQNHALVYNDYHRSQLVCVCDQDEARAKEIAARFGCDYTTDLHEIARSSDIEAVSIATPDFAHFAPAMTMIQAGKHVLIEKPLATDLDEAIALARAARTSSAKTMVDFGNRWNPTYMMIKDAVTEGRLGKPYMGYARLSDAIDVATKWFSWSARSGPHWFLLPHTMDIMRWYFAEEPTEVYAHGRKGVLAARGIDTYDSIQALVRFDQAFATFETSWIVPNSSPNVIDCYLSIYGTEGKAELDADYGGLAFATDKFTYPWAPVGKRNMYGKLDHRIYEPIKYFIDCIVDDVEPSATLFDGVVNTAMIAATIQSIAERRPIPIDVAQLRDAVS